MNTPSVDLPEPKIKAPLSFIMVSEPDKAKEQRAKYLDSLISKTFLANYFKKKKIKK